MDERPQLKMPEAKKVTVSLAPPKQWVSKKSWYSHINTDTINNSLHRTIFHPWVAFMGPLCMRAMELQWTDPSMVFSLVWFAVVLVLWTFNMFSRRIAYGLPRDVDLSEEVIIITGGSSGLGQLIAEVYGMRGASVAILDVKKDEGADSKGLEYYECDVGDRAQVEKAAKQIEKDLGVPTILINNAGICHGKSLLDLTSAEVEKTFRTNTLAHFNTIQTFLPGMLDEGRGTVVTVSSVLGYLGAAQLSDYTASKAAVTALHESLTAELKQSSHPSAEWIRTILVTPGQMATDMFPGVKTPSNFFAPIVEPHDVAKEIIRLIDNGQNGKVAFPVYSRWIGLYGALPVGVQSIIRRIGGIDAAMKTFKESENVGNGHIKA